MTRVAGHVSVGRLVRRFVLPAPAVSFVGPFRFGGSVIADSTIVVTNSIVNRRFPAERHGQGNPAKVVLRRGPEMESLVDKEQVLQLVLATVRQEADELGYDELRAPTVDTTLFGGDVGIDSLSLVRLVAAVERAAQARFGKNIVLADERAMSMRNSPFRTTGALAELLHARLSAADA